MKKSIKPFAFSLVLLGLVAFSQVTSAQAPPPPPAEKGSGTNKAPGGGAPIDGGLYITIALAAAFAAWKTRSILKRTTKTT
ncbi:MAG: PID-CTERM protein-sorting domain-containing protein [Bacteroidales bacterium]